VEDRPVDGGTVSNEQVLARLVEQEGSRLIATAYLLTRDRSRAEDLVQETLLQVIRRWSRTSTPPENATAYVRKALLNSYLNDRRRAGRRPVDTVLDHDHPHPGRPMESAVEDHDAVWRLLGTLPPRQRAVLVLRYYEDLPDDEIAAVLGCRRATVRSLAHRGLAGLRVQTGTESLALDELEQR
jgi:RNA polymerase sigma-70 factor (sigma-E family)